MKDFKKSWPAESSWWTRILDLRGSTNDSMVEKGEGHIANSLCEC
jgi:hypothetical protein